VPIVFFPLLNVQEKEITGPSLASLDRNRRLANGNQLIDSETTTNDSIGSGGPKQLNSSPVTTIEEPQRLTGSALKARHVLPLARLETSMTRRRLVPARRRKQGNGRDVCEVDDDDDDDDDSLDSLFIA
jgi:hypothetical protein